MESWKKEVRPDDCNPADPTNGSSSGDQMLLMNVAAIVTLSGLGLLGLMLASGLVARGLAVNRRPTVRAVINLDGYQEARITIDGKYRPENVVVQQGVPVRLRFLRQEDTACSERVVFSGIGVDRRLPAFTETVVEFVPYEPGTFIFTCDMGMYRGKLIVLPENGRTKRAASA